MLVSSLVFSVINQLACEQIPTNISNFLVSQGTLERFESKGNIFMYGVANMCALYMYSTWVHCGMYSTCVHCSMYSTCVHCGMYSTCMHCNMYSTCVVWPTLDVSVNRTLTCQYPISWYNNVTSPMRVAIGQLEMQVTIIHANLCGTKHLHYLGVI